MDPECMNHTRFPFTDAGSCQCRPKSQPWHNPSSNAERPLSKYEAEVMSSLLWQAKCDRMEELRELRELRKLVERRRRDAGRASGGSMRYDVARQFGREEESERERVDQDEDQGEDCVEGRCRR
jgi:hypothetical protein